MTVSVNGQEIPASVIAAEAQHHPSDDPYKAWDHAAEALAIRELLLGEARRLQLVADPAEIEDGAFEAEEEALIRRLLEQEVHAPVADAAACRRYFEVNKTRFKSPDIFEASHILIAASPEDKQAYAAAIETVEELLRTLKKSPGRFEELAETMSACPSKVTGGNLGQLSKGQTVPEFETFLFNLESGQTCPVPVKTRYGVHVLRVDRKIAGKELPFEAVADKIARYLQEKSWRKGVAQYIRILAGRADIEGVDLKGEVGLVQ